MNISDLTERELVARIQQHLPPPPPWMIVGIGDDAAVVAPERNRLEVLSVDAIVEGVHFNRRFTPPEAIGHRALAVNLSDLAAMGAEPRLALLSMALPPALSCDDFDGIATGLAALAARYKVHVAGGNLTQSALSPGSPGPIMIDVTVMGTAKRRQVLTRSGARPGDEVYVSGAIGGAAEGLRILRNATTEVTATSTVSSVVSHLIARYLYPEPRVRLGLLLGRNRAASACVDLSDGLADGIRQIATASGVGMTINAGAVPIEQGSLGSLGSQGSRAADAATIDAAIAGGDDYELLFTVRPRTQSRLRAARRHGGTPLTRIGVCTAGPGLVLERGDGDRRPIPRGYGHFR